MKTKTLHWWIFLEGVYIFILDQFNIRSPRRYILATKTEKYDEYNDRSENSEVQDVWPNYKN